MVLAYARAAQVRAYLPAFRDLKVAIALYSDIARDIGMKWRSTFGHKLPVRCFELNGQTTSDCNGYPQGWIRFTAIDVVRNFQNCIHGSTITATTPITIDFGL